MVFQHFMLADNLTVLENVVLGAEKLHGIGDAARAEISAISERYGFGLDPDELVETLGVGERQRVEILKVLYRGAKIIILDEPTAVLVPQEVDALFDNLRQLKDAGPHPDLHLPQARRGAGRRRRDHRDPSRHDRRVGEARRRHLPPAGRADGRQRAALAQHRGVHGHRPGAARACATSSSHDATGRTELADIDFDIHAGEVLGIAGVEGNGQTELVETLIGMRSPVTGDRRSSATRTSPTGRPATGARPASATSPRTGSATACCSTHRCGRTASSATRPGRRRSRAPGSTVGGARGDSERIVEEYDVRTPGIDTTARALSGGNQQKFIVGREMSGDPVLLVASHPTRGVDVGAQAQIWDHIKQARREGPGGAADLGRPRRADRALRHRSGCCCAGGWSATFDPRTVTPQELGSAMTGAGGRRHEPASSGSRSALAAPVAGPGRRRRSSPASCCSPPATTSPAFWNDAADLARGPQHRQHPQPRPRCSTSPASQRRSASG